MDYRIQLDPTVGPDDLVAHSPTLAALNAAQMFLGWSSFPGHIKTERVEILDEGTDQVFPGLHAVVEGQSLQLQARQPEAWVRSAVGAAVVYGAYPGCVRWTVLLGEDGAVHVSESLREACTTFLEQAARLRIRCHSHLYFDDYLDDGTQRLIAESDED